MLRWNRRERRRGSARTLCCVILFVLLVVPCIIVPLTVRFSSSLQRRMTFATTSHVPVGVDVSNPESAGLEATNNFYLRTLDGVRIGVWHLMPKRLILNALSNGEQAHESNLDSGPPVIIYFHGNTGSRASPERLRTCGLLRDLGFHVVSFDYRSFGDSDPVEPSRTGVHLDARAVYDHVKTRARDSEVFLWGHSLGSSIAADLASRVESKTGRPAATGIVLEAPFNNVQSEVRLDSMASHLAFLPWFDWAFLGRVAANDLDFATDQFLKNVSSPLLILHAEDDPVVPYKLGQKLHDEVVSHRKIKGGKPVKLVSFGAIFGYGHNEISTDGGLPKIIRDFLKKCSENIWTADDYAT